MTAYFMWQEGYATGDPEIDEQHRYLFHLANSIQGSKSSAAFAYAEKLYAYTQKHFGAEERHMAQTSFPQALAHMKLHNGLLAELNSLLEKGISTEEDFEKLKLFFLNWLVEHILYHDKKYFRYVHHLKSDDH